tara:strand:+ start:116 stop:496 length:381 start_codon:yes stop_codon:yes gene_type:complete
MIVRTLIDITETRKHRNNSEDTLAIGQQANFMTFVQTLMLRKNVYFQSPTVETIDVTKYKFGNDYKGEHKVWSIVLTVDEGQAMPEAENYVKDFDLVPVIPELSETIPINNNVFRTRGKTKNIIFE